MLKTQSLSATHRPWPSTFHIHPLTRSLADLSANSTSGRSSITFKRITPISSCLQYSRIGSNYGLNPPRYVLKRSAILLSRRRQALPVPATYRLWSELFSHPSSYSLPISFSEFSSRIRRNLKLFRENYNNIFLLALFLGILWNPISITIIFLPAISFVVRLLVLTGVWLNVLVSLLIGVGIVVLHATFWESEKKEDDFTLLEEEADTCKKPSNNLILRWAANGLFCIAKTAGLIVRGALVFTFGLMTKLISCIKFRGMKIKFKIKT